MHQSSSNHVLISYLNFGYYRVQKYSIDVLAYTIHRFKGVFTHNNTLFNTDSIFIVLFTSHINLYEALVRIIFLNQFSCQIFISAKAMDL